MKTLLYIILGLSIGIFHISDNGLILFISLFAIFFCSVLLLLIAYENSFNRLKNTKK